MVRADYVQKDSRRGLPVQKGKTFGKWFGRWCRVIVTGVVLVWMDRKHWYGTRATVIHLAGLDLIRAEWALTHAARLWLKTLGMCMMRYARRGDGLLMET